MKARIIFNCILVTMLLGSHAVFANPHAGNQDETLQEAAGYLTPSVEVEAVTTNLLNMLNYDIHAEVVQRIIRDSRQELSRQLDASSLLLDALKFSVSHLKLSINNTDGILSLTAR
jgi:hypothetical protein